MTLPRKPPLVHDWDLANWEKRTGKCRVCGAEDRKIELAHVVGVRCDTREAVEEERLFRGKVQPVRVAYINPDRVVPLCGPQVNTGTCHYRLDLGHDLELWDHLTDREKRQAVKDAGSLGQALHRLAPLTWENRLEFNANGDLIEVAV